MLTNKKVSTLFGITQVSHSVWNGFWAQGLEILEPFQILWLGFILEQILHIHSHAHLKQLKQKHRYYILLLLALVIVSKYWFWSDQSCLLNCTSQVSFDTFDSWKMSNFLPDFFKPFFLTTAEMLRPEQLIQNARPIYSANLWGQSQ